MPDPRAIALFLPNWVGDVVMATPAAAALRRRFPAARLVGVCRPYVADVVAGSSWFDRLILADKRRPGTLGLARELRGERVDTAVLFPNSFRPALSARLAGCRRVVGYARYGRSPLLTDRLHPRRGRWGRPVPSPAIDDYNALARRLGAEPGHRMELATTAQDERAADGIWQRFPLGGDAVGLNPGAAFGSAKCWPAERFAELARLLAPRPVLVLCGPAERELARRIAAESGRPGVYSLADAPVSIGLTKACVRRLSLLVTTDSGPRHFAAALGRPVVTLFGPTHIAWTETYYPRAIHLQKPVPCGPCQRRVCRTDHRCMLDLTAAEVYAACRRLLAGGFPLPEARHAG